MTEHFEHQPQERDLPSGETNWTSEPSRLAQRIRSGIDRVDGTDQDIDDATALAISRLLAKALPEGSAMAEFTVGDMPDYETLRDEYLTLYNAEDTPEEVKRWIDWFGSYVISARYRASDILERHHPALDGKRIRTEFSLDEIGSAEPLVGYVPATASQAEIDEAFKRIADSPAGLLKSFRAFLTLPDVDLTLPGLVETFYENYVGEYEDIVDALRGVTELDEWEAQLETWCDERGLWAHAAEMNLRTIEFQARASWDFVDFGGRVYVFTK